MTGETGRDEMLFNHSAHSTFGKIAALLPENPVLDLRSVLALRAVLWCWRLRRGIGKTGVWVANVHFELYDW